MALKALVVDIVCCHIQRLPSSFYIFSMYGNPVILCFAIADNSIPSCHRQMFIDIPESNRRLGTWETQAGFSKESAVNQSQQSQPSNLDNPCQFFLHLVRSCVLLPTILVLYQWCPYYIQSVPFWATSTYQFLCGISNLWISLKYHYAICAMPRFHHPIQLGLPRLIVV